MNKVALALLWIAYSTWYSYRLRPVEWLPLKAEPVIAHPGIMSTMYRNPMDQIQALVDANVPVISAKGLQIQQAGKTIYLTPGRIPMTMQDLNFIMDHTGHPVIWITERKEH